MREIAKRNGLTITLVALFLFSLIGHIFSGMAQYNDERSENKKPAVSLPQYLRSGDFAESLFENWESEFLQMGLFVALTAFLFQAGSPESKKLDEPEEVDRAPDPKKKDAPWAVRKGGFVMRLYSHSLTAALLILFVASFVGHLLGGAAKFNEEQRDKGKPAIGYAQFAETPQFWYQSFQNWQSEFMSIGAMVVLSIYLRQKGSSQSKPVDAPHSQTGS